LVVSVVVDDAGHRLPAVLDVVKVPPDVAGRNDGRVVGLKQRNVNLNFNETSSKSFGNIKT
jgi:hypothetical protein